MAKTNKKIYLGASSPTIQYSGGAQEFTHTAELSYSITTDFRYRDTNGVMLSAYINSADPGEQAAGAAAWQETKTITWTVGSNAPIVSGTFLDGTPWVRENTTHPIHLISVTPEPGVYTSGANEVPGNTNFVTNQTVINPDFGKIHNRSYGQVGVIPNQQGVVYNPADPNFEITFPDREQWRTTVDHLIRCTNNECVVTANGDPRFMLSLDGRSGRTSSAQADGKSLPGATGPGDCYDPTQVWNRQTVALENGDMILSAISHVDPNAGFWGSSNQDREPMYDMFGTLTIVPVDVNDYTTYYRPPINWDPTLKTQRPYLQAKSQTSLDSFNMVMDNNMTPFESGLTWDASTNTSRWFTPDFFFTSANQNNDLMGIKSTPLRLGSVRLMAVGSEIDDTAQGWTRDMACTHNEYGGWEQGDTEAMFLMAFDAAVDSNIRTKIRHCLAQRGIDVYGAYRSLGKWNSPNGSHASPYDWYLLYAYAFVADNTDIADVMAGNIGMVANDTNFNLADNNDSKISGMGSCVGHMNIPSLQSSKRFHPGRLRNLEIINTGTDAGVDFIDVLPPAANTVGQYDHTEGSRTYYNVIGNDDRFHGGSGPTSGVSSMGRWATKNNASEIQDKHFIGGYLRGPQGITRIVDSSGVGENGIIPSSYDNNGAWYTDRPQRFWIQDSWNTVVSDATDLVDLSPYVMEDLSDEDDRAQFIGINYSSDQVFNGGYNGYIFATICQAFCLPFLAKILGSPNNLPEMWKKSYENAKNYYTDPIKTCHVREPGVVNTSYYLGETNAKDYGSFWKAAYRKYILPYVLDTSDTNWPPTTTAEPVLYSSTRSTKISQWQALASTTSLTWDELPADPAGVTMVLSWPSTYVFDYNVGGNNSHIGNNSGAELPIDSPDGSTAGSDNTLHRAGTIVTTELAPRDGFFFRSKTTNGPVSHDNYMAGKTVYVQLGGACEPIALERLESTVTADDTWFEVWALPASTPRWPDTIDSWSHVNKHTIYVANSPI